jgi:hypothetical protein
MINRRIKMWQIVAYVLFNSFKLLFELFKLSLQGVKVFP